MNPTADSPALALQERFHADRARLFAIAYRMLGTVSDAEDVLQDAYLRLARITDCVSPGAMLTTIVVRLCLDHLKSARVQRESYTGPWLPEPVPTDETTIDRASIALAFLVLLESLSPAERAVYVLHEVFDFSHEEIARTLDKRVGTCRQLLRRARARVGERQQRFVPAPADRERVLSTFVHACATGDIDAMRTMLADDVRAAADSGGLVSSARNVLEGRDRVARFLVGIARRFHADSTVERIEMNGAPALIVRDAAARISTMIVLDLDDDLQIADVAIVRSPPKLAACARALAARTRA